MENRWEAHIQGDQLGYCIDDSRRNMDWPELNQLHWRRRKEVHVRELEKAAREFEKLWKREGNWSWRFLQFGCGWQEILLRAVVLKVYHAAESLGGFVKIEMLGRYPRESNSIA